MENLFNTLAAYFCGRNSEWNEEDKEHLLSDEKPFKDQFDNATNAIAADVLTVLLEAETTDDILKDNLNKIVGPTGWTERLAMGILTGLINAIKNGTPMGKAATEALKRALNDALQWAKEHPEAVLCTIVALGILVILTPWVIKALGFAEAGPIAETFAAWWQSHYAGYVPKGSLFSYFQRLGLVWRLHVRL